MATEQNAGTGASRTHRYWRVLGQIFAWAVVAAIAWLIWPSSLGGNTSFVIVSGQSMAPTYESGDLVIAYDIAADVGDVIVYSPASLDGAQVVHRIIGGDAEAGWQVQGDNNDFVDPFFPSGGEVRGVVLFHLPHAGAFTTWLLNPLLWGALILAGLVIFIWPPAEDDDEESDETAHEHSAGTRKEVAG